MAGIEDRYRRFVVDGEPVVTGMVALGDAGPAPTRRLAGAPSLALVHACLLRDLLRETDPADHDKFARRFDELTDPDRRAAVPGDAVGDRHRLAEIDADLAGTPYRHRRPPLAGQQGAVRGHARRCRPDPRVHVAGVLHRDAGRGAEPRPASWTGSSRSGGRPAVPAARPGPPRTARRDGLNEAPSRPVTARPPAPGGNDAKVSAGRILSVNSEQLGPAGSGQGRAVRGPHGTQEGCCLDLTSAWVS